MPGNRKTVKSINPKIYSGLHHHEARCSHGMSTTSGLSEDLELPVGGSNRLLMPKHIALPPISCDGELLFETLCFVYVTMALGLQYLNLYRTVWWLPHSHNKLAVNFYLIDVHLTAFIVILLGRRFFWCVIQVIADLILSASTRSHLLPGLQRITRASIGTVLVYLIWCIAWKHPVVKMLYLLYPVLMYAMLYRTDVRPFFELIPASSQQQSDTVKVGASSSSWSGQKSTTTAAVKMPLGGATVVISSGPSIQHTCSTSAAEVRSEVDALKTDFNNRLNRVLVNSLLSTYYVGFIPCCFAQSVLYYESSWTAQQMVCLWLSCFTLYVGYLYPPQYCNVLHSSALHLGRWHKVEGPAAHMPHTSWSETILWQQGALVKHKRELFRAEGLTNAAEPGNTTHSRFYVFFRDPSSLLCGLVGLQLTLVLSQFGILLFTRDWNYVISHTLLISSNYYILFKLIRDFLVLGKVYKTEDILQHKIPT